MKLRLRCFAPVSRHVHHRTVASSCPLIKKERHAYSVPLSSRATKGKHLSRPRQRKKQETGLKFTHIFKYL